MNKPCKRWLVVAVAGVMLFAAGCAPRDESQVEVQTVALDDSLAGIRMAGPQFTATVGKYAFVAGVETNNVVVVDLETLRPVRDISLLRETRPHRLVLSQQGVLAVGGVKFVSVFDVTPILSDVGAELAMASYCMFPCSKSSGMDPLLYPRLISITSLALGHDGQQLYIGMIDREPEIARGALVRMGLLTEAGELRTGFFQAVDTEPANPAQVQFQPVAQIDDPEGITLYDEGRMAVVVDQDDSRLFLLNLATGETSEPIYTGVPRLQHPFAEVPYAGDAIEVVVAPDNSVAYVSNVRSNTIAVVDLGTEQVTKLIPLPGDPGGPFGLTLSRDGRYLFTVTWGSDALLVIDTETQTVVRQVAVGDQPVGVALGEDGRVLVANSGDNTLSVVRFADLPI